MQLNELDRGRNYRHKTLGKVLFIAPHPHDGACLFVERYVEGHDLVLVHRCESSDLIEHIPDELDDRIADQIKAATR